MSDLLAWVRDFREAARRAGDERRVRLTQLSASGFALRETDPDGALAIYEEGRRLAEALGEPWWALYYDYWRLAAKMHFQRDFRSVLDLAIQCVLEIRKPYYDGLPLRTQFHVHLIDAYRGIDPHGHSDAIREAQEHLAEELRCSGERCFPLFELLESRRDFALATDDLDGAEQAIRQSLSLLDAEPNRHIYIHYATFDYGALCEIAWRREDWASLAEASAVAEDLATQVGHRMELAGARMWQALAALQAGDRPKARRLFRQSQALVCRMRMSPEPKYFDALCGFLEAEGDVAGQWGLRERELASLRDRGRIDAESRCRLKRCRLLARLGRPMDAELAAAREAAGRLKEPAPRLAELDAVARGEAGPR